MTDVIRLDTVMLDKIASQLDVKTEDVIGEFAFSVERETKQNAPTKTSAMKNSTCTRTKKSDWFSAASSAAKSANPGAGIEEPPSPSGNTLAIVAVCVDYAGFVEFGTSRMAAQPFFTPAIESRSKDFNSGKTWEGLTK